MNVRREGDTPDPDAGQPRAVAIDELLDRAVAAINSGDRVTAAALAEQVLAADTGNADAEDLLDAPRTGGLIRRLTVLFADLADSTALSTRVEPETYRLVVGRYRDLVRDNIDRYEGHIGSLKGDGLLAVFGHPTAHEDDARRAVLAALGIIAAVTRLGAEAKRRFGVNIAVRIGVHRGVVYLDTAEDDVYGLAANLAARVSGLAAPGTVVVSDAIEPLIRDAFELRSRPPATVKGVAAPVAVHHVVGERAPVLAVGHGPLVGRDRELARLRKSWARARAGTLSTAGVVFRGEPGIGKSRLVGAATELVGDCGAVLELIGSPFHTDAGLHPVRTLLERRCGIDRGTDAGERLRLLRGEVESRGLDPATAVALLAPVLGVGADAGYTPVAAEGRTLYELISRAVRSYLLASLGDAAGLVVTEDMHWFDPSTIEMLGSLLREGRGRVLLVGAGRPGGWLPPDWPIKVFDLTPLTGEQSEALIAALNPGLTSQERAVVADRCDGVPFYIEQIVAGLSETGVPETLYEPLFARLRAGPSVLPVVQAAAVIGRDIDRGLLYSVVGLAEDTVDDVLDELEDARVLEPSGTDSWRFRHELLREVAAELAPPSVQRGWHASVADALVGGVGGDPDWRLVAAHYKQAQRFDDAASAYQRASAEARRRGALAEARSCLTEALTQLEEGKPGPDRDRREMTARLEHGFLAAAVEGNQSRAAATDFERCLQLGGTDLRDDELFATLTALAGYYIARADLRRIAEIGESLNAGLEQGRQWFRPMIDGATGVVAFLVGDFTAARSLLETATAARGAADQQRIDAVWYNSSDPFATADIHLALTRAVAGDLAGAETALAAAARRADDLDFPQGPYSHAYAHFAEIWLRIEAGQLDRAADLVAELLGRAERHGFDGWRLWGATLHAIVDALVSLGADAGAVAPATIAGHIATLTASIDTLRALGVNIYRTFYEAVLARLFLAAGEPERARERLDGALALAEDTWMHFYDAELLRLRAGTHTDPENRTADLDAARALARRQGAALFELRTALDDVAHRGRPAAAALAAAVDRFPAGAGWPELARARATRRPG